MVRGTKPGFSPRTTLKTFMPPRKKPASKKSLPDSFRIKIGGSGNIWTTTEQRQMLIQAMALIESLGVQHGKAFYLYYRPTDERGNSITHVRGEPLKDETIDAPYRSAADEHGA